MQGRGHHYVLVCHYNPAGNKVYVNGAGVQEYAQVNTYLYFGDHGGRPTTRDGIRGLRG